LLAYKIDGVELLVLPDIFTAFIKEFDGTYYLGFYGALERDRLTSSNTVNPHPSIIKLEQADSLIHPDVLRIWLRALTNIKFHDPKCCLFLLENTVTKEIE
jgi:hypothetical protein